VEFSGSADSLTSRRSLLRRPRRRSDHSLGDFRSVVGTSKSWLPPSQFGGLARSRPYPGTTSGLTRNRQKWVPKLPRSPVGRSSGMGSCRRPGSSRETPFYENGDAAGPWRRQFRGSVIAPYRKLSRRPDSGLRASRTRVVIPSLRVMARASRRRRRSSASTGLSALPKFSLRISLPASITAARSSARER
jgi:hypothetical protein